MSPLQALENPICDAVRRACSCSGGTPLWASNGDFVTLRKLLTLEVLALLTLIVNIVHLGSRGSQVPITLGTLAVILRDIRHIILWLHQWVCYWCFESIFWCLLCLNSTCRSKGFCGLDAYAFRRKLLDAVHASHVQKLSSNQGAFEDRGVIVHWTNCSRKYKPKILVKSVQIKGFFAYLQFWIVCHSLGDCNMPFDH